jgi:Putative Flp pilus-assembly TadE/G-like
MRKNQKGQTLIFAALALTVLLGFAGLAVDMGVMRYERRLQQTAADAAAVAGASNLPYGGIAPGAQNAATSSGYTDGSGNDISQCSNTAAVGTVCVQVNNPPAAATVNGVTIPAGPHSGDASYVEVIVATVQQTYFMRVLGVTRETVTARAVGTNVSGGGPNTGCLYTLGLPASSIEGVNINGSAWLNAPTCGIADNGNFNTKGNALVVTANTFGVTGDANISGPGGTVTCTSGQSPCPTYGMPAAADPLAYLAAPGVQTPNWGSVTTSGTMTLSPGTYSSITFGKNSTTTLSAGIYYINGAGGVTFNGAGTVTGTGVMFYFTNGATINATGGGNKLDIQLSPPTSGTYKGILFYQDPNDTAAPSLGGDNKSFFNGVLYFPKVQLTFFGNNTSYATGIVVADAIALSGNPTVNLQGTAGLPPGVTIASNAHLVE